MNFKLPTFHSILAITALLVFSLLTAFAWTNYRNSLARPSMGVVALDDIFTATELYFAELLTRKGLSEEEKQATYQAIKNLPTDIDLAIHKLESECRCWVFNKSAVLSQAATDYTSEIKTRILPNSPDLAELQRRINERMSLPKP
ncbi:MAG: hypothetical protein QM520_00255 [Gammaproteobacteria bacterium]|nr:hypothetical protein [Gammaproteobacteria bacterium]